MITLCILDGFGVRKEKTGNAILLAGTPHLDKLKQNYSHTIIDASGTAVGLPEGQMGNSEVGHMTIGAGRIIEQDLLTIDREIESGEFAKNEALVKSLKYAEEHGTNLHIMGLCSNGGVHSKLTHMLAILDEAKKYKIKNIYIHAITDGRDTPVTDGVKYLAEVEEKIKGTNAKIVSVVGRVYNMDRENRYDRVEKAYRLLVYGEGEPAKDFKEGLLRSYSRGVTDEFVEPIIIDKDGVVKDGDSIIFFNYRSDRAREITFAFTDPNFSEFKVEKFDHILYSPMQQYHKDFAHLNTLYPPKVVKDNLSAIISEHGLKQLHISETTKYAHVTFFFNGGQEAQYEGEDRILIDSYNDQRFDNHPKMRAPEITEKLLEAIKSKKYDFLLVNFSNPDMIGHTGNLDAAIETIKVCDECVGKVVDESLKQGGECIIIADHGNAEEMIDKNGNPQTAHTSNPVPFILVSERFKNVKLKQNGSLANVAPTILQMMGIKKPDTMQDSMIED